MSKAAIEKKRTTIYISEEVLEYLAIRRAKGAGSVSQQLEDLAREKMPKRLSRVEVTVLEARDLAGYQKQPQTQDDVEVWQAEQVWDEP